MELIDNIERVLKQKNIKQSKMLVDCGLSTGVLSNWRNRDSQNITLIAVKKIADYLNVSIDELIGRTVPECQETPLDADTRELLDGWNKLSNNQKQRVLGQIQGLQELKNNIAAEAFAQGEASGRNRANIKANQDASVG